MNCTAAAVLHQLRDHGARRRLGDGAPRLSRRAWRWRCSIFSIREGTTTFENNRIVETRFRDAARGNRLAADAWGCMDITEPDAGSDMARLRADRRAGRRRQLVRHRPEDLHHLRPRQVPLRHRPHREGRRPERPLRGPGGLSFFLVPAYEEDDRRQPQAHRHARPRRRKARPPRLPHRGPHLRALAGSAASASAVRGSATCCS